MKASDLKVGMVITASRYSTNTEEDRTITAIGRSSYLFTSGIDVVEGKGSNDFLAVYWDEKTIEKVVSADDIREAMYDFQPDFIILSMSSRTDIAEHLIKRLLK